MVTGLTGNYLTLSSDIFGLEMLGPAMAMSAMAGKRLRVIKLKLFYLELVHEHRLYGGVVVIVIRLTICR